MFEHVQSNLFDRCKPDTQFITFISNRMVHNWNKYETDLSRYGDRNRVEYEAGGIGFTHIEPNLGAWA